MNAPREPRADSRLHAIPVLRRGDHLRAGYPRGAHHDGIYLGNRHVIHLTAPPGAGKAGARVRIDTLAVFAASRPVTVRAYTSHHDPDVIIARAISRLGDGGYHLIFSNCQHFARWCATGDHVSEQVDSVTATSGTIATPVLAASVGINLVGSGGLAAGLSGSGIMSGLAAYGSLVGSGALAGLVVLGAAPGLVSVGIMNWALRSDDSLPHAEQDARTAGRAGSVIGVLAGSAGAIAAVSVLGVPGLGATGISSGACRYRSWYRRRHGRRHHDCRRSASRGGRSPRLPYIPTRALVRTRSARGIVRWLVD